MINLEDTCQHVHFVGIGGVGVSAIAEILHDRGFSVSGSDAKSSHLTDQLEQKGMKITYYHAAELVEGAHFVVYTTAVDFTHPELARATELGIPCISRPDMLGMLMDQYPISIAVSGAHGKTTTSSMISMALVMANMDPTILIGGEVKDLGSNARVGSSGILVAEACEYKESFLSFHPNVAVLLNIDADHLDYYRDLNHIVEAFERYVEGLPKEGTLIYNGDDPLCVKVAAKANCLNKLSFGFNETFDLYPKNVEKGRMGYPKFDIHSPKGDFTVELSVPGEHNIYNTLAAFAAISLTGANLEEIAYQISHFTGAGRRFDDKGIYKGAQIIDDYAHHPSEVMATLKAAKGLDFKRVLCIFQPHTYTRTLELMNEFSVAFKDADELIITDIYAAREKDNGKVHATDLVAKIAATGQNVIYLSTFEEILNYLDSHVIAGDIVFTMGAGSVSDLGPALMSRKSQ